MLSLLLLSVHSHENHGAVDFDVKDTLGCHTFDVVSGECFDGKLSNSAQDGQSSYKIKRNVRNPGIQPCPCPHHAHIHSDDEPIEIPNQQLPLLPYPNNLVMKEGTFSIPSDIGNIQIFINLPEEEKDFFIEYLAQVDLPFMNSPTFLYTGINVILDENIKIDDEAYILKIQPDVITLRAAKKAGLFYGLQTLIQIFQLNDEVYFNEIPCLEINDAPSFKYRGLMLDVSRHFYSKEFILKQLDMLSRFKINHFHFHLVDAGGWRLEIKKYPELTEQTAYRPESRWFNWWITGDKHYCSKDDPNAYGGYYTQEEMKEIIKFAQERFITIIPEIEMPGHSDEIFIPYPNLCCSGKPYQNGDFCVGNPDSFTFVKNVLDEVIDLFPSEYIHVGGDEASMQAWRTCPKCQALMKQENMTNVEELQSYFIKQIDQYITDKGRKLIGWDEILKGGLAPHAAVMSWTGEEGGIAAAKAGHMVVMTPGDYCYIDHYQDAPISQPDAIGGYVPLSMIYNYHPVPKDIDEEHKKYIYGVQANLWTEYVTTPEHVEYMIYPRILGIAEAGWTNKDLKNFKQFSDRALRCVKDMESRGYHPYRFDFSVGDRVQAVNPIEHMARGKKVHYYTMYNPSYSAGGDGALTDGKRGNWAFNDKHWQGFAGWVIGWGFDAEVDLGEPKTFHQVFIEWYRQNGVEIYWPKKFVISVSDDQINYTTLLEQEDQWADNPSYGFATKKWVGEHTARYIRVQAASYPEKQGWLFADEIVVQ